MPAPFPGSHAVSSDNIRHLTKEEMWHHIFLYTFQIWILKLPPNQVTAWNEGPIDTFMEIYMDYVELKSNPIPRNINQMLIDFGCREQWTVAQLVWTAIALRLNAIPTLWAAIQECFNSANRNCDYAWMMPIPINRTIRKVDIISLPTSWA